MYIAKHNRFCQIVTQILGKKLATEAHGKVISNQ